MELSYNPTDYLFAFFGGLLLSFTPCTYPLIPVAASFIGLGSGGKRIKAFILSLAYVSGIAVTYSVLGITASISGKVFGMISTYPITFIIVGLIIIIFGLSMLEVFNISIPLVSKRNPARGRGLFSVFIFGLSSGLMISPCVTPALGSILAYIATKKNIFYGATLLLSFAYGMGFILIIAGTFSSILLSLPKSGKWLEYVRRIYAVVLMGMGLYFIITGIRRF